MARRIEGIVSEVRLPTIEVSCGGRNWPAIIDTGFNGDLQLPEELKPELNARLVGRVISLLAANQQAEEDLYLVDAPLPFARSQVQATFVPGHDVLVGTGMLRAYRLAIDFPAATVGLEPTG